MLQLCGVKFRWPGQGAFGLSLSDFAVHQGETVLLLGESGSGKSTLLSLICGTVLAHSGQVLVAKQDISELSAAARDRFRVEHIGMIFQQFNLLPFGSVVDNILLPIRFAPQRRRRAGDGQAEALRLCRKLGLQPNILPAKAARLSVGQQQRVAVARALIGQPPIVIADEPTSALDAGSQSAFLDLLFDQVAENNTTLLMVSHDPRLARRFDRVLQMEDIAQIESLAA
ncbi:ABC transporter ATP-binding protein [uncultured Roseobacter sp.]|uniref:ABC transporter ATP-binding protein n=1 Tax=uncultured Roseobacter sp. TaxID=114847 RepID=UPI002616340F|nr:ABC transporter ATP-binding protein [uncultured Roseobacter sp.]